MIVWEVPREAGCVSNVETPVRLSPTPKTVPPALSLEWQMEAFGNQLILGLVLLNLGFYSQ
jgi:hypothetical protein